MIMSICKFPLPACTFIVICIYVQLQETVTVYVIKYLSIYMCPNMHTTVHRMKHTVYFTETIRIFVWNGSMK